VVVGAPGTGKTVLAQQICFANASPERPAVYYTTLPEPHDKLVRYLEPFRFFNRSLLGKGIDLHHLAVAAWLRNRELRQAHIFSSVYAFVLFLSDFVAFPRFLHGVAILATLFVLVMSFIERPDLRFDPNRGVVHISGVTNPISYRTWISFLLIYLAVAFGVLAVAFAVYGGRLRGLARMRMLLVGGGFFLLFVAIGLVPRLLFGGTRPRRRSGTS
jgi:hypothetical protein